VSRRWALTSRRALGAAAALLIAAATMASGPASARADTPAANSRSAPYIAASAQTAAAHATDATITQKVLLIVFDPIMESLGGQRLHAAYGWQDPVALTNGVVSDLEVASHGVVDYQIAETDVLDAYPWHVDGTRYDDASWIADWAAHTPKQSKFDWQRLIDDFGIVGKVASGAIDEVWIYQDPLDQDSAWESTMAGDGAYWLNSPPVPGADGPKAFVLMSWNYERGVAEALHSYGHRAENNVCRAFGTPPGDACVDPSQGNDWGKFVAIEQNAPGKGGIGTIHFPVNGTSDYDYANTRSVLSSVDAWANYPDLSAPSRLVSDTEWSPTGVDPHRDYLRWWYSHLPHVTGVNVDGRLDDWWRYIVEVDRFKDGGVLPGPGVVSFKPDAAVTNATAVAYSLGFDVSVTGLTAGSFSVIGTASGCSVDAPTGGGAAYRVTVSGCSDGTVQLSLNAGAVQSGDAVAGPPAPVAAPTVTVDRTAPTATVAATALRVGGTVNGWAVPVTFSWSGSDAGGSGVLRYEVERSTDGLGWEDPASAAGTSLNWWVYGYGTTYVRVRALDRAGNTGAWAVSPVMRPALVQQTAFTYRGWWKFFYSSSFSGGCAKRSTAAGSWTSYRFTGRTVAIVTARGPTRGSVRIYLDGKYVRTLSLHASTSASRVQVWAYRWQKAGTHTLKIVVVGTAGHPRFDADAVTVIR
jgi:hypothetical protein